jgi:DNA-binding XRE family transcriptional regulator
LAAHHEAVEFMHAHVERGLSTYGLESLKVVAPWWPPVAPWPLKVQAVKMLEAYYRRLEFDDEPTAVHKAAAETGRAEESVRAIVRLAEEGVLATSLTRQNHAAPKKLLEVDGLKLRKLRHERALSQRALKRRAGVSQGTINALEGAKRDAQLHTIKKLAEALGVEPKELMKGEGK